MSAEAVRCAQNKSQPAKLGLIRLPDRYGQLIRLALIERCMYVHCPTTFAITPGRSRANDKGDSSMSTIGICVWFASWVAAFSLLVAVFVEMDPDFVDTGHVAVRGVVIQPYPWAVDEKAPTMEQSMSGLH
jgi:hypothetical protein